MSVNIRDAAKAIKRNMRAGVTTLLRSDPGMGKSEMSELVCQWFLNLPEHEGKSIGVSTIFMATQSPISATGLPWKGEKTWRDPVSGKEFTYTITEPAIAAWFMAKDLRTDEIRPASMFHKVIFIAEEWGQGGADTKKAFAEVLRAGGTPPFYMPPGSPRLALSNTSVRDGVNKEFDFILNRVQVIDMHPDCRIWVDDFGDKPYWWYGREWNVTPFSKTYALQPGNENNVCEAKPDTQGPWCTFRSYTAADRIVQIAAEENGGVVPVDSSLLIEQLAGTMGPRTTTHYIGQMQFAVKLPSYDKVVADPAGCDVPKQMDLQMLMAYELAARAQPQDLAAVLEYLNRLADGMDNVFIGSVFRKDYRAMSSEPAMKAWISKNAARMSLISSLAAGM
jgi:hypothetical protein